MPSEWLTQLWKDAISLRREVVWNSLPDQIGDTAEIKGFSIEDLEFVLDQTNDGSLRGTIAAIYTLGRIGEDFSQYTSFIAKRLTLLPNIKLDHIRCAVVESLWQLNAKDQIKFIENMLTKETNQIVLKTIQHVLKIFKN